MGIREAKKYIDDLHKRQDDPYLWPDFLSGLPDKAAIIKEVSKAYEKPLKYCIAYVRIANIQPYLIKYGPDRHAEVIQWAAAILKTTSDKQKGFVGAFSSHDFILVCAKNGADALIKEATELFNKKMLTFYSGEDVKKGCVMSFMGDGKKIKVGFMKLISISACGETDIPKDHIIQHLGDVIDKVEKQR